MTECKHGTPMNEVCGECVGETKRADASAQAELLHDDNQDRIAALEAKTGNPGSLENAFDALKMITFIEHVTLELGIADRARLDFEGRRAQMLTQIELKVQEMDAARQAAERQARLAGGPVGIRGGQPMRPGPGGIVRPSHR